MNVICTYVVAGMQRLTGSVVQAVCYVHCPTEHLAGMHIAPRFAPKHVFAIAEAHMYTVDAKQDVPCSEVHLQVRVWEAPAHLSCC